MIKPVLVFTYLPLSHWGNFRSGLMNSLLKFWMHRSTLPLSWD